MRPAWLARETSLRMSLYDTALPGHPARLGIDDSRSALPE